MKVTTGKPRKTSVAIVCYVAAFLVISGFKLVGGIDASWILILKSALIAPVFILVLIGLWRSIEIITKGK